MAESHLFLRNRTVGQTIVRVALVCSLLLNGYFLFLRDHFQSTPPEEKTVVVQGVTIAEDQAPPDEEQKEPEPEPAVQEAEETATENTVADTAGQVLDPKSGLRLLNVDVSRNIAYTFDDVLGSENGKLVSA